MFGVIDTLAVMLRFYLRKRSGIRISTDDWLILASLIPAYAMILDTGFCQSSRPESVERFD